MSHVQDRLTFLASSSTGIQNTGINVNSSAPSNRATSATHSYISSTSGVSSSPFATHQALQTTLWPQDSNINIHTNSLGNELPSWPLPADIARYNTSSSPYSQSILRTPHAPTYTLSPNSRASSFSHSSFQQPPQRSYLPSGPMTDSYPSPQHSEVSEQVLCSPNPANNNNNHNNNNFVTSNAYFPRRGSNMAQTPIRTQDHSTAANASPPRNAAGEIYCAHPACRDNPPTFARKCEWT